MARHVPAIKFWVSYRPQPPQFRSGPCRTAGLLSESRCSCAPGTGRGYCHQPSKPQHQSQQCGGEDRKADSKDAERVSSEKCNACVHPEMVCKRETAPVRYGRRCSGAKTKTNAPTRFSLHFSSTLSATAMTSNPDKSEQQLYLLNHKPHTRMNLNDESAS